MNLWYINSEITDERFGACRPGGSEAATKRCPMEKDVLKNFTKFTAKHLCQSPFFNKLSGLRFATLSKKKKKKDWQSCFLTNFVKFLRLSFLQTTSGRLSLAVVSAASFTGVINSNVMFSSNILLIYWLLSDKIKHFRSTFPLYT